jgi:hypothetical protein
MLTLDQLLEIGGVVKTAKVKLLRHTPPERAPDAAWKEEWLHEYDRMHETDFKIPEYFVTFIPVDRTRARFLWVKKVVSCKDRRTMRRDRTYPFPQHYESEGIGLDLARLSAFDGLEGRVIVNWGLSTRGYHHWRNVNQPKQILQILSEGSVDRFPGYAKVFLNFERLRKIIEHPAENIDWHAALGAVVGIYLITNEQERTAYVGKAAGVRGFLGRWSDYVKTRGHGGNVELRRIIEANPNSVQHLRWSIIHVLPNDTPDHEIDELEKLTKAKFGTRIIPLNRN